MSDIVTREVGGTAKGSPLTNAEVDNNFINLNAGKEETLTTVEVSSDYSANVNEHLLVTCSTADITITLPTPGAGGRLYITKIDSTSYKIITGVKDILYQNTTMQLRDDSSAWRIV